MHGLINRSIQTFLRDTYGAAFWQRVARSAGLEIDNFETMLLYEDASTGAVVEAASNLLARPRESVLEDLGTYLVSHPNLEPLRRLLRFGGVGFVDFLHSLDELPGRTRLAVPDLELPHMELTDEGGDVFSLVCRGGPAGFGHVMVGILRTMADDYGALVVLEHKGAPPATPTNVKHRCRGKAQQAGERIVIRLLDQAFAQGRRFDLAAGETEDRHP